MNNIKPLGDILKMTKEEQHQEMLGMIYDIHTEMTALSNIVNSLSGGNGQSRIRKISIISAIGVFAGSSIIGLIMGIINWLSG